MTTRSIALFVAAAIAEIGGAYLVWVAIRDDKGILVGLLGALSLAIYGVVAAFQPENESDACWPPTAACSSSARWRGALPSTASALTAMTSVEPRSASWASR